MVSLGQETQALVLSLAMAMAQPAGHFNRLGTGQIHINNDMLVQRFLAFSWGSRAKALKKPNDNNDGQKARPSPLHVMLGHRFFKLEAIAISEVSPKSRNQINGATYIPPCSTTVSSTLQDSLMSSTRPQA